MLIPKPNGDRAQLAHRDAVLDVLRPAPQAPATMADAMPSIDPLKRALDGRYRVVGELGRGAMGVVYLAYEPALQRPVALKVLAPRFANDPKARKRFLREARTAASVAHPNIVPIHAVGEAGEFVYFTMQYVDGDTLGDPQSHWQAFAGYYTLPTSCGGWPTRRIGSPSCGSRSLRFVAARCSARNCGFLKRPRRSWPSYSRQSSLDECGRTKLKTW